MILAEPVLLSLLLISDLTSNRVVVNILVLYDKYHNLGRFLLNFEQKIDKSMISILYDAKRLQNAFIFLLFFFTWEFWWTRLLGKDKEGNKQKILKLAKVIVFMGGGGEVRNLPVCICNLERIHRSILHQLGIFFVRNAHQYLIGMR